MNFTLKYYPSQDPIRKLKQELRIRGFSPKTVKAYLNYNKNFLKFIKKSPKFVKNEDIKRYLEHLANRKVSNATLNLVINALKFHYEQILRRRFFYQIKRPRREKTLPVVLSKNEVKKILKSVSNQKHRLCLSLIYAVGLMRVSEVVRLGVRDLDFDNEALIVRGGKGKKDRQTLLPENLIEELKAVIEDRNSDEYVFESNRGGRLTERSVQKIFLRALKKSGIKKKATCHSFRYSFVTPLLEKGVDIRYIQELLGHKRLETTQIYTKVTSTKLRGIKSPLEDL